MATFDSISESISIWINSQPIYHRFMDKPLLQRYLIAGMLLLLSFLIIFGLLYSMYSVNAVYGFFASILTGLATGIGALPVVFIKSISSRLFKSMLGLSAGVMLAATTFALIVPGIEFGEAAWPSHGWWIVSLGMLAGAGLMHLVDDKIPYFHLQNLSEVAQDSVRKVSLFVFAVTIHNFPEGISVGVSFGTGLPANGIVMATAIGLQNLPEGLAVALPLIGLGYDKWKAVLIATFTGFMEPLGGLLGVTMVAAFAQILPIIMGFAAGAMLFVISEEIIPQTHRDGTSRVATFALLTGFIVMMAMEHLLD